MAVKQTMQTFEVILTRDLSLDGETMARGSRVKVDAQTAAGLLAARRAWLTRAEDLPVLLRSAAPPSWIGVAPLMNR